MYARRFSDSSIGVYDRGDASADSNDERARSIIIVVARASRWRSPCPAACCAFESRAMQRHDAALAIRWLGRRLGRRRLFLSDRNDDDEELSPRLLCALMSMCCSRPTLRDCR